MHEYSVEELRQTLFESSERFYLVDTLPEESYRSRHIPGALSLPLERLRERAAQLLPELEAEVITYCSGPR